MSHITRSATRQLVSHLTRSTSGQLVSHITGSTTSVTHHQVYKPIVSHITRSTTRQCHTSPGLQPVSHITRSTTTVSHITRSTTRQSHTSPGAHQSLVYSPDKPSTCGSHKHQHTSLLHLTFLTHRHGRPLNVWFLVFGAGVPRTPAYTMT